MSWEKVKKILAQEHIADYTVLEDKHDEKRKIHRVTILKPDGCTLQINTSDRECKLPEYEVIDEKHEDGVTTATIKCYAGTARVKIPDHTPEEEKRIMSKFVRDTWQMIFPDEDWSQTNIKILK